MSKHSLARFVAILLLIFGIVVMLSGILSVFLFGRQGFGSGWSEGFMGWFTLPLMGLSCSAGFGLLMLGAVLLLLVDISRNISSTKVIAQKPAFVETIPTGVVTTIEPPAVAPVVAAGAAAALAADAVATPEPGVAAPVVETVVTAEEPVAPEAAPWTPRMAEEAVVTDVEPEPATIEFADSTQVGVPAPAAKKSARAAQIEIAEETVPELQPQPAPKKTRKRAAATVAAAAVIAAEAAEKEPPAEDMTEIEASVAALKSGVDALEGQAEPQLPGAQEAARISAELAALNAAPKRQRKPAKLSLKLAYIDAISEENAARLNEVGVRTTEDLLTRGATRKGRQELAEQTGLDVKAILTWVNHVDLFRIRGVGEEFAQLLELSGVDTVVELAQRNAANLQMRLAEVNDARRLVRQVPVVTQVERWIEEAKTLPRVIKY